MILFFNIVFLAEVVVEEEKEFVAQEKSVDGGMWGWFSDGEKKEVRDVFVDGVLLDAYASGLEGFFGLL